MHAIARRHRPLIFSGLAFTALTVFAVAAVFIDDRTLMGQSPWIKVAKFGFAFAAYSFTLAWLIGHLTRLRRLGWWTGTVFAAGALADVGVIAMAAALGTYSHFNTSPDPANQVVQAAFTYGVLAMFTANLVIAIVLLFQRVIDRAATAVVRWGIALATFGMVIPFVVIGSAGGSKRVAEDAYGDEVELSGAHGVGDPDGAGMLLTGWSTTGGDLRAPHFVGLHGIQVLLAAAVVLGLLAASAPRLRDERLRAALVHALALGYTGFFASTVWQAMRGQSFAAPDAATLAAFGASAAVTVLGSVLAFAGARRRVEELEARESVPVPIG